MTTRKTVKTTTTPGQFGRFNPDTSGYIGIDVKKKTVDAYEFRTTTTATPERLDRVLDMPRWKWDQIAAVISSELNWQIVDGGGTTVGRVISGENKLCLDNLGKEALVLIWAVEAAETTQEIDHIAAAWRNLHPVERWWLFNQTVTRCGKPQDAGHGWRLALRNALSTGFGPQGEDA
ncbi:DUF3780 domain-containing protein [Deinococcus fonticola]|uniref:DUF3780 domain-containing protein n=1 Tax=Deinococcus fonticola TaxID=2528713 RepID=UPI001074B9F1|nr:DUF3780 domain-containing protein [Deinococcus fonticola]